MELLSVCPLRIAALVASVGPFLELRVVVRATLERDGAGMLELSKVALPPDVDDCAFLHAGESDPVRPRQTPRKILGNDAGDGAHFVFDRAPAALARSFLPDLRPRLFVEEQRGAREIMLERAVVRLDLDDRRVTVLWYGKASLGKEEVRARAVVALERGDDLVTWAELLSRTQNLDTPFVRQRAQAELRKADPRFVRSDDDTLSLSASDLAEEIERAALPFSGHAPASTSSPGSPARSATRPPLSPPVDPGVSDGRDDTAPLDPAMVEGALNEARAKRGGSTAAARPPEKRTIGQVLADQPTRGLPTGLRNLESSRGQSAVPATPEGAALVKPDVLSLPRVSEASAPARASDGVGETLGAIELVWSSDESVSRMRRDTVFKRQLGAPRAKGGADMRETRLVATVTRSMTATPVSALGDVLAGAAHEGVIEAPLVVAVGLLALSFDPVEALRTLVSAALPLARQNEKLARAIDAAKLVTEGELSDSAWMLAEGELSTLRSTMTSLVDQPLLSTTFDAVDRKLARDKKLATVSLGGETNVVATLFAEHASPSPLDRAAVYLPEAAATCWPLTKAFAARIVAEVRPSPDDRDPAGCALFPIAIYRVVALTK